MDADHEHTWNLHNYDDTCHIVTARWACACGARRDQAWERNLDDPWSFDWLTPDTCERCRELQDGATPRDWTNTYAAADAA